MPQDSPKQGMVLEKPMRPDEPRVEGAASSEVEMLEDVVPDVTRWYEPERLKAYRRHEVKQVRPRVSRSRLITTVTSYGHLGVLVVCCGLVCCVCCFMLIRQQESRSFMDYHGQSNWLLSDFMHCREVVVHLKRCLWRFQMVEPMQHDDLLLYSMLDLQHLNQLYKEKVLRKIAEDPRIQRADDREYLDQEMKKLRKKKRRMKWLARILRL